MLANITHGHNGFLTAALFGSGLPLLPTRPVHAGALLGLLAYKPQYGLLIPLALAARRPMARHRVSCARRLQSTVAASIALFGMEQLARVRHARGLHQGNHPRERRRRLVQAAGPVPRRPHVRR